MKLSFVIHPNNGKPVRLNRVYQVSFLNVPERNIETWTTIIASQIGSDPDPDAKLFLDCHAKNLEDKLIPSIACSFPNGSGDNAILDETTWGAIRKIWGAQSTLFPQAEKGDLTRISPMINEYFSLGDFENNNSNQKYLKDCGVPFSKLAKTICDIHKNSGVSGIVADRQRPSLLPFQYGNGAADESIADSNIGCRLPLAFGKAHQSCIPSLWIVRHDIEIGRARTEILSKGIEFEFIAPSVISGDTEGYVGEYRHYFVAPRLFDLEQRDKLSAGLVTGNSETPQGPNHWTILGVPTTDKNSLDKMQHSHDAYFPDWISKQFITQRDYYKINLPSPIGDYQANWQKLSLTIGVKSIFKEYTLFLWGIIVPIILAFGIDGDRLSHLEKIGKEIGWATFFNSGWSYLFQWTIWTSTILAMVVTWIFGSHLQSEPRLIHLGSVSSRWRLTSIILYTIWIIGIFGLADSTMQWLVLTCNCEQSGALSYFVAPRIFGILAWIFSLVSLYYYFKEHVGLFDAIVGLFPGLWPESWRKRRVNRQSRSSG